MHIGMVLDESYPPDIRVSKEAGSLAAAGHEVTLLCEREEGQPRRESDGPLSVVRVSLTGAYDGPDGWLRGVGYQVTKVHPTWLSTIERAHETMEFDALHVHDLPLVKTALEAGERYDLPVVADLHENWPAAVEQYRKSRPLRDVWRRPKALFSRLLNPIARLRRLETHCVRRANRVIAVTPEGKEHYVADCGADPADVSVVSNFVDREVFAPGAVTPASVDGEFVISYVGTLSGEHRGLKTVIRAMPVLAERVPDPRFLVVGSGGTYERALRDLVHDLDIEDFVEFTGWVDFDAVPSYIAASDVCVVPYRRNSHTATTVPHKLFQYMAMGKPVVVTDIAPLRRVIEDADAGVVVPPDDPAAFARALAGLHRDPERTADLGANGQRAVETTYNWSQAGETLCDLYRDLSATYS